MDNFRKDVKKINKEIGQVKKIDKEGDVSDLMAARVSVEKQVEEVKLAESDLTQQIKIQMRKVGNLVHDTVPISQDEKDSVVVSQWGEIPDLKIDGTYGHCHHHEILAMIDGYDPKRG